MSLGLFILHSKVHRGRALRRACSQQITPLRIPRLIPSLRFSLDHNAFVLPALDVIQSSLEVLFRSLQARIFLVRLQIRMYELDEAV